MRIAWIPTTNIQGGKGYSRLWHQLGYALFKAGVEHVGLYEGDWDLRISLGIPKAWFLPKGSGVCRDLVYLTMWDTDSLPPEWLPVLARARAVWVPSRWMRNVFVASGVERPVYYSGYGVDPDEFRDVERDANQPFTFMTMGRKFGDRKGASDVMAAFMKLNLPDAKLIIKLSGVPWTTVKGWEDRIEIVNSHVPQDELAHMMARADAFVYPHKGEGFGLEPLEAMAAGTCTILTDFSGPTEYIRGDVCVPLPVARMVEAHTLGYEGFGRQAEVDPRVLQEAMLWAYKNRDECWRMGQRAAEYVKTQWTWDKAGEKALAVLEQIMAETI